MPLNDIKCKNIKPTEKTFKVSDVKGLYLEVNPNVAKYWRLKYRLSLCWKREKISTRRLS